MKHFDSKQKERKKNLKFSTRYINIYQYAQVLQMIRIWPAKENYEEANEIIDNSDLYLVRVGDHPRDIRLLLPRQYNFRSRVTANYATSARRYPNGDCICLV